MSGGEKAGSAVAGILSYQAIKFAIQFGLRDPRVIVALVIAVQVGLLVAMLYFKRLGNTMDFRGAAAFQFVMVCAADVPIALLALGR